MILAMQTQPMCIDGPTDTLLAELVDIELFLYTVRHANLDVQHAAIQRAGGTVHNALVLDHHIIRGAATDIDNGDGRVDAIRIQRHTIIIGHNNHIVVPGSQRLRNNFMKGDAHL